VSLFSFNKLFISSSASFPREPLFFISKSLFVFYDRSDLVLSTKKKLSALEFGSGFVFNFLFMFFGAGQLLIKWTELDGTRKTDRIFKHQGRKK